MSSCDFLKYAQDACGSLWDKSAITMFTSLGCGQFIMLYYQCSCGSMLSGFRGVSGEERASTLADYSGL